MKHFKLKCSKYEQDLLNSKYFMVQNVTFLPTCNINSCLSDAVRHCRMEVCM